MQLFNECFLKVKTDCFKFISSQETKKEKFKNKEKMLMTYLIPLCFWIVDQKKNKSKTLILGLSGGQGIGKTTITSIISIILKKYFNKKTFVISIDDFYKTIKERYKLSQNIHPLLQTRGVPGTHDVKIILNFFRKLNTNNFKLISLPKFDKSIDDRFKKNKWYKLKKKPDIVILEGWCVGARPQKNKQLIKPVNLMEKNEDMSAKWRKYVNFQLKTKYKKLYSQLTSVIYIKTQSFNLLRSWRIKQERKLKTKKNINSKVMTNKEVKRFMMTYERITLQMFKDMPKISKVVLSLNKFHQINNIRFAS